ncbi:MAG TPA: FlgD immunoglobulin-like domain containing protein, partial [Candidatus Krumholzibacteriaceae bacterium]
PSACVFASWEVNGNPISTATGNHYYPQLTSDGAGGAIITWADNRSGNYDIYAQRVDASGAVQWAANGVAICTATGDQFSPTVVSDGAGGAIITWEDYGLYVHAQRVNASGAVQWAAGGIILGTASSYVQNSRSISDSAGGAIVTWEGYNGANWRVYAQRVDASGAVLWTTSGVALCTATGDQEHPAITSDGAGGAIVAWDDGRGNQDIYAQRVNASGAVQWTADGVALCAEAGLQQYPAITSDGAGGAIATWMDGRVVGTWDIYAQRVDASGAVQWIANGMPLCTAAGNQGSPAITTDGAGGAIVTWHDGRSGNSDIYAQRVNASGAVQWTVDGVGLCTATGDQELPAIVSDGAGGAIVAWTDGRSEDPVSYDIYAQRVNASGSVQWPTDGAAVCTATGDQYFPSIASDGAGGAIVAWADKRNGNFDIYAQRVCQGVAPVATLLASFSARVEESVVRVGWELSEPVAGLTFDVLRSSAGPEGFEEISATIESNGKAYSFADLRCIPGSIVRYRVDVTESGARRTLFETDAVAVPVGPLALFQNAPNPFNPTTTLRYYLPAPCEVTLSIYDASGRLVATLVDRERQEAGQHAGIWSGLDSRGSAMPSGVYFSVITAGKERLSNKMILLR